VAPHHSSRPGAAARSAARHGAASLAHAAGADLKTVQEQLGHTSIVLTADTYTSVLIDLHFTTAEATARLVLAAAARNPGRRHRSKIAPPKPQHRTRQPARNRYAPSDPATAAAPTMAAHPWHTRDTPRSRPHSQMAIRPGQYRCAARDSNPEPAD